MSQPITINFLVNKTYPELKRKGLKLAVVTNKFNLAAQDIINKYFPGIFDVVLGETKELNRKPYPDMCNYVLKELGITSCEALYVGDSDVDIMTAKNANLKCLSCSWGFKTKDELISFDANIIIESSTELLKYLN